MTPIKNTFLVIAVAALGACSTNADRFGDGTGPGAGGITDSTLGDPADPSSIAYFQQTVGDRVLFVVDQSTLTPAAQATVGGQAAFLMANPEYSAIVEGHADERGTREYNLALGARRASAVQDYLVSQGVAPNRIQTVTYGKERPLEICSEEACYQQNRRAVTVLTVGVGS